MFGFLLLCGLLVTDVDVLQELDGGLWLCEEVKGQVEDEQGEGLGLPQLTARRLALLIIKQFPWSQHFSKENTAAPPLQFIHTDTPGSGCITT